MSVDFDWRCEFWGTKWDCYEVGEWTAWSPATSYYLHISKNYLDVTFKHTFADEGGEYIGYETFKNGKIMSKLKTEWNSEEGIKILNFLNVNSGDSNDESTDKDENETSHK